MKRRLYLLFIPLFSCAAAGLMGCGQIEALRRINGDLEMQNVELRELNKQWSDRFYEANELRKQESDRLGAQIEQYRRDLNQARNVKTGRERELESEVRSLSLEIDGANEEKEVYRERFEADLARSNRALIQAGEDIKALERDNGQLRAAAGEDRAAIAMLDEAVAERDRTIADLVRANQVLDRDLQAAESASSTAQGAREEIRRQAEAKQRELDAANREIRELRADLEASAGGDSADVSRLEGEIAGLEAEIVRLRERGGGGAPAGGKREDSQLAAIADQVESMLAGSPAAEGVELIHDDRGLRIIVSSDFAFEPGSIILTDEVKPFLRDLGNWLERLAPGRRIRVEGHTDPEPPRNLPFADNWGVGSARADRVRRYLVIEAGVTADRLALATRAFHDPLGDNESAAGRARNRRVEIVVTYPPP